MRLMIILVKTKKKFLINFNVLLRGEISKINHLYIDVMILNAENTPNVKFSQNYTYHQL